MTECFHFLKARLSTVMQRCIADVESDGDGRLAASFHWATQDFETLDDQQFFESSNIRFESAEMRLWKGDLCRQSHWQAYYLVFACLWYRFSIAYPGYENRSTKSQLRWITRQIERMPSRSDRAAVWRHLGEPFNPGLNRDASSIPLDDVRFQLQKKQCECVDVCKFTPDRWCKFSRRGNLNLPD
jgi:hypothetical protein